MATQGRKLYTSSNGDSWYLCRGRAGKIFIFHDPNAASSGKPSEIDLGTFLAKGKQGPEHQALRELLGELVDSDFKPAEQFLEPEPLHIRYRGCAINGFGVGNCFAVLACLNQSRARLRT
jgi:hypothetical protein